VRLQKRLLVQASGDETTSSVCVFQSCNNTVSRVDGGLVFEDGVGARQDYTHQQEARIIKQDRDAFPDSHS
jgi:hypothetical protein